MNITYFYRNHKVGFSIKKVADLYVNKMEDKEIYEMPSPYASMMSIFKNMWFTFKHRNKNGINHITGDIHYCIIPLMRCKTVLTVHDTSAYDCAKGIKKILIKYLWFIIPLKLASKVICISNCTKTSLSRFTKRKDIAVIPNAVDSNFSYTPKVFNKANPNILLIGTNWNKNIESTVKALHGIDCQVTIIGKLNNSQLSALKANNISYINKLNLSDEEINTEYKNCDIVSFCSLYEGFGMPIIEANATGRAVITSNISPMTEVGGKGAIYVNPLCIQEIRTAFIKVINNQEQRKRLVTLGLENAKRFCLNKIVKDYIKLYNSLLHLHSKR